MRACPRCHLVYPTGPARCRADGEPLVEVDADPLLGLTIDRYEILEPLGEGSMGRVYLARHSRLPSARYAVKVLFGEIAADPTVSARFRREAEIASTVDHQNVISVVDFGSTPAGLTYMVMEYVSGVTLRDALLTQGPLGFERMASITKQIAAGLSRAHELGYVHRDLKPGNILLTAHEGGDLVKIVDFGIAGIVGDPGESTKLTQSGETLGTPLYMPPEQLQKSSVGPAADIYSLGVILYEMVVGRPPFQGDMADLLYQKLVGPPRPPPAAGGLGTLSMKMLEIEERDRPATAREVVEAIDAMSTQRSSEAQLARTVLATPTSGAPASAQPGEDSVQTAAPSSTASPPIDSTETALDLTAAPPQTSAPTASTSDVRPAPIVAPSPTEMRKVHGALGAFLRRNRVLTAVAALASVIVLAVATYHLRGSGADAVVSPLGAGANAEPLASPVGAEPSSSDSPPASAGVRGPRRRQDRRRARVRGERSRAASEARLGPPGPRPLATPDPLQGAETPDIPASDVPRPEAVSNGYANVVVTKGGRFHPAAVLVDGRPSGRAPLQLELAPGVHTIRVRLEDGSVLERTVEIVSSKTVRVVLRSPTP